MNEFKIGTTTYFNQEKMNKRLDEWGVPPRYYDAKLSDFPYLNTLDDFETKQLQGHGYYICGPAIGCGKTRLLCALLKINDGSRDCMFASIYDIMDRIKDEISNPPKPYTTWDNRDEAISKLDTTLSRLKEVSVLAIDDLGVEYSTDFSKSTIFNILNYRYNNLLSTYVSSNFHLYELADKFDPRIASRLAQMCYVIEMRSRDRRLL